jgi:hypothetical protein
MWIFSLNIPFWKLKYKLTFFLLQYETQFFFKTYILQIALNYIFIFISIASYGIFLLNLAFQLLWPRDPLPKSNTFRHLMWRLLAWRKIVWRIRKIVMVSPPTCFICPCPMLVKFICSLLNTTQNHNSLYNNFGGIWPCQIHWRIN